MIHYRNMWSTLKSLINMNVESVTLKDIELFHLSSWHILWQQKWKHNIQLNILLILTLGSFSSPYSSNTKGKLDREWHRSEYALWIREMSTRWDCEVVGISDPRSSLIVSSCSTIKWSIIYVSENMSQKHK